MKINDISLPYPVLGISDDVYPLLKNDCVSIEEPVSTPSSIQFKIHLRQKNKEITQFVKRARRNMYARSIAPVLSSGLASGSQPPISS